MNAEQIAKVAKDAGFPGDSLPVAVAVALAESGGNPSAHNATPPDDSYGLWQINMLGNLGPARRATFGLNSNSQLFDPAVNAKAALAISSGGTSWGAWSTYTNGAYRAHLDEATAGAGKALGVLGDSTVFGNLPNPLDAIPNPMDALNAVAKFLGLLLDWDTWRRILYLIAGASMFGAGVLILTRETDTGRAATDLAMKGAIA